MKETLETEETYIEDLLKFRQQKGYRDWAKRVDLDVDAEEAEARFEGVPSWRDVFGVVVAAEAS